MSHITELQNLLLENRAIKTDEDKNKFLNPDFERDMHDPYLMRDMEKAVVRVFEAMEAKEKIVIYGDYDCDGIPGSVILHDLFKKIGYENFSVYIPDRHEEGYGLHKAAIEQFKNENVKLIITVDLGTVNFAEVALAETLGIDVIISDHHLPKQASPQEISHSCALPGVPGGTLGDDKFLETPLLPRAFAVLNPKLGKYPEAMLCGSGVAFKLVQAFIKKYGEYFKINLGWEKWLLDMAGLATLSDMVPLLGENRTLAYFGMKVLQKNRRPGLQKLLKKLNIDTRYLVEDDITFMITPRLNAASRMDSPRRAFELLASMDESEAGTLADHLSKINDERKILVAIMMKEIKQTLGKREEKSVIVIGNPKWRAGVLGLAASKITEEYKRPAFVWGMEGGETIKGSCRSDGSVNLVDMMALLPADTLLGFGGHELAGGFSVSHEQVHFLSENLEIVYGKTKREFNRSGNYKIDKSMTLDQVSSENYKQIEKLAPFGLGNPKPTFLFEGIEIVNIKRFGKASDHLELSFKDENGRLVKAIQFFKTEESFSPTLKVGDKINLVANLEKSMFRGRAELRLRIVDVV